MDALEFLRNQSGAVRLDENFIVQIMKDFAQQLVEKDRESRWISVKERLPEKNEWVLVYIKCKNLRDEVTYETHTGKLQGTFWVIGGHFSFDIGEPLFWQPLPEPPKL